MALHKPDFSVLSCLPRIVLKVRDPPAVLPSSSAAVGAVPLHRAVTASSARCTHFVLPPLFSSSPSFTSHFNFFSRLTP